MKFNGKSRMMNMFVSSGLLMLFTVGPHLLGAQPAFPGAEGFGATSVGGRGGEILKVTNLNDKGPGSLRQAVESTGPRIVVFEVSGTIELQSRLTISQPYITIAGQTAPGAGICLKNHELVVKADQVIIRFLRVRPGDNAGEELDALWVAKGHNIIIDHCSVSWGVDETLSVATSDDNLGNVTIQWCMITESLNCSLHDKGCHGYGSLVRGGWGNGYTFHHNLYAHHRGRSPRPGNYNAVWTDPDGLLFDFRNNVVYNWAGSYAGYNADTDSITRMNFVGNYYIQGPNSTRDNVFREQCPCSQAFFSENAMDGDVPIDPWTLVRFDGFSPAQISAYVQATPIPMPVVSTDDPFTAYASVLREAGATLPERDLVDVRIVTDVINGTGRIINDEDEVGAWPDLASTMPLPDADYDGMPDEWEVVCNLNPNDPNDAYADRTGDGYTNIEEYINSKATRSPFGPTIIWVADAIDEDGNGVQDDQAWIDWLGAEGYEVDARRGYWKDPLEQSEIAELEAADLIIASRTLTTTNYDGPEASKWNSISTPLICLNAWMLRANSKWCWMASGDARKDAGAPRLVALDIAHPVFKDIPLDESGVVEVLDADIGSGHTSFLNNILDVGNGTLIAQTLGLYDTAWIVEWDAGAEFFDQAGQFAGGKRMMFMAGTQDDPYGGPRGAFNLNAAGQQILRNMIAYLIGY